MAIISTPCGHCGRIAPEGAMIAIHKDHEDGRNETTDVCAQCAYEGHLHEYAEENELLRWYNEVVGYIPDERGEKLKIIVHSYLEELNKMEPVA